MSTEETATFIEEWLAKASKIDDDKIRSVIVRTFDAIKNMNKPDTDDIVYYLASMRNQREVSHKHETELDSEPLRNYFYGINEAIEKTISSYVAKFGVHNVQLVPAPQAPEAKPVISTLNIKRERQVTPTMDETRASIPTQQLNVATAANGSASDVPADAGIPTPPHSGSGDPAMDDMDEEMPASTNNTGHTDGHTGMTPRSTSRPPRLRDFMNTLDCPGCPESNMNVTTFLNHLSLVHKKTVVEMNVAFRSTCGFVGTNASQVRSHNHRCNSCEVTVIPRDEVVQRTNVVHRTPAKATRPKKRLLNATPARRAVATSPTLGPNTANNGQGGTVRRSTSPRHADSLGCPRCAARDMNLADFITHLQEVHDTTLAKANLAFKCCCGFIELHASSAHYHKYHCRSCSFTVVKRPN